MNSICHQKQFKLSRLFTLCFAASVAMGVATTTSAASLGHSRLVSGVGQALRIHIPIKQINANELASLNISPAPQQQWQQSGLTPPVDLSSISIGLIDGATPNSHVVVVSSQQIFDKQIADLLLDVKTDSGNQVYQVSILAQNDATVIQAPSTAVTPVSISQASASASGTSTSAYNSGAVAGKNIVVKSGDNMFAIAKRNAVANTSVYQMMIALQRANPNAFINGNINLVKAGATLTMPDSSAIHAVSDSQARKVFHQQVLAFKQGFTVSDNQNLISNADEDNNSDVQAIAENTEETISENTVDAQSQLEIVTNSADITPPGTVESASTQAEKIDNTSLSADNVDKNKAAQLEEKIDDSDAVDNSDKSDTKDQTNDANTTSETTLKNNDSSDELKLSTMINGAAQGLANSVSGAAQAAENSDAAQDAKVAADKAVEYTKEKISQLEENVKNLNEALTAQGTAASEAIIEGALELQKALSDDDITNNLDSDKTKSAAGANATESGATTDTASGSDKTVNESSNNSTASASTSGSDSSSTESGSVSNGSGSDTTSAGIEAPGGTAASTASATDSSSSASSSLIAQADKPKAWFKKYFLAIAGGLIGFIILIIVWVLRRSYVMDTGSTAAVTPEMVQEKLNQINLNLDEPSIKEDK